MPMNSTSNNLGGTFTFFGTSMNVRRMGYGAMQLAGPGVFGQRAGFNPLQSDALDAVAASLGATSMQVALAWLLLRSPNVLLIPGTSSVQHLRENLAAAELTLPAQTLARLNAISAESKQKNQRKDRRS
jgi:diketogulonate reductase-like aldo/keto reductase